MHPSTWRRTDADVADWFEPEAVARSRAYMRPVKRVRAATSVVSAGLVLGVIAAHVVPRTHNWAIEVVVASGIVTAVGVLATAPAAVWVELVHDKGWELSTQTPARAVTDQLKGLLLGWCFLSIVLVPVYWAIRHTGWWWLLATGVVTVVGLIVALVYPVLVMPLFNAFDPIEDDALREDIEGIARRAGVTIRGAFTMDASKRSRRDNAFVAGFGPTKRVVVFDTMLEHPRSAIEQVVAHELGHYRLNHIPKQVPVIVLSSLATFGSLEIILRWNWLLDRAGVRTLGDPRSVPLFVAAFAAVSVVVDVAGAWVARAFEREADLEALRLLEDPDALIDAFRRMQSKNISDLEPSWARRVRASHPEMAERMAFARAWATQEHARP